MPQRDHLGRRVVIVRPGSTQTITIYSLTIKCFPFLISCSFFRFLFIFFLSGVFDPYKYSNTDMLKIHGMVYETLMEDEENQIRGYVHLVDATGITLPYMTLFTPKEAVRIVKNAEVNRNE